jgi:hypothetical protein
MSRTRRFALVAMTVAALSLGASTPASFGQAASLSGEFFESVAGETTFGNFTCNQDGTTTIPFEASGLALGPYLGTFTESGTVTIGQQTDPLLGGPIIGFSATFEITSTAPSGTVTGSKQLSPTAPTEPALGGAFGTCAPDGSSPPNDVFVNIANPHVLYTAQIDAVTGSRTDRGTSSILLRSNPPPGGTTFQEAFNSTEPVPEECEDDEDEQGDSDNCDEDDQGEDEQLAP